MARIANSALARAHRPNSSAQAAGFVDPFHLPR